MKHVDNMWVCDLTGEDTWSSCEYFDTKDEAIQAGRKVAKQWNSTCETEYYVEDLFGVYLEEGEKISSFSVGQCKRAVLGIDIDSFLEQISEDVFEQCGECAEGYLSDVKEEDKKELLELIYNWFQRKDYMPTCYTVENIDCVEEQR